MRLVAVAGAAPGIGKSTLCTSLASWLTDAGLTVDHFEEDHVFSRSQFAPPVEDEFTASGMVAPTVLVDATVRLLWFAESDGVDVVVADSLILDGDAASALHRTAAREGPDWLRWYAARLTRYGLVGEEPTFDELCAYLSRERTIALGTLQRQQWELVVVDAADSAPPATVVKTVRDAVAAFVGV